MNSAGRGGHPARRAWLSWLLAGLLPLPAFGASIVASKHNLSAGGPGAVMAGSESQICIFCHTPHYGASEAPLWNRYSSGATYLPYGSTTAKSRPGQPTGASKLCLSCHDGTVALGDLGPRRRVVPMVGAQRLERGRRGFIGTDLSGSHPVSFVVPNADPGGVDTDRDLGLKPLALVLSEGRVPLDSQGKMQCTTCHDPHSDRNYRPGRVPHFWISPTVDEVCLACHELR
jgi:hypothetical protein